MSYWFITEQHYRDFLSPLRGIALAVPGNSHVGNVWPSLENRSQASLGRIEDTCADFWSQKLSVYSADYSSACFGSVPNLHFRFCLFLLTRTISPAPESHILNYPTR